MKSLADRMKSGIPPVGADKFTAADSAMAGGNLYATPEQPAVAQQPVVEPVLTARDQAKVPAGTSAVVRENFSFPPADSELIDELRKRAARGGVLLNRSEMLRAGLAALNRLSDAEIAAIAEQVPKIKTGRPKGAGAT